MELFNESDQLQTFSRGGSLNPGRVGDTAGAMEREFSRYQQSLRFYEQSRRTNQEIKLENARKTGQDLKDLGQFSKAAYELGDKLVKRFDEAKEINDTYNFYFGDKEKQSAQQQAASDEEESIVEAGEQQAVAAADLGVKVEQTTGSAEAAEVARQTVSPLGQAVTGDKAAALQASTMYPAWIGQYLQSGAMLTVNGQQIPIRDAASSLDPGLRAAAVRQGRMQFFEQMGLAGVSRRNVVKYLIPQIQNAEASASAALGSAAITRSRDEATDRVNALGYNQGRTLNTANSQSSYDNLSNLFYTSGTGMTRAQANEAAVKSLISGAVAAGNPEAIQALRRVLYNPNLPESPTNTLGGRLGALIDKGVEDAKTQRDGIKTSTKSQIEDQLYTQLAQTTDPATRRRLVSEAAAAMRRVDPKAARALEMNWEELSTPAGAAIRASQLEEGIANGEIRDASVIRRDVAAGLITPAQGKELEEQLGEDLGSQKPTNKEAADIAGDVGARAAGNVAGALGLTRDANGVRPDPKRGQTPLISPGDFEVIEGAIQRDVNRIVNQTIRQNPNLSQADLNIKIQTNLKDWYNDNLMTEGGKYYIGDIVKGRAERRKGYKYTEDQRSYWNNLINSPVTLSTAVPGNGSIVPQPFQSQVTPGQTIPQVVRNSFNPLRGDTVFSQEEVEEYAEDMKDGEVNPLLAETAQGLGMSPLALLQQQLGAYRLPPVVPKVKTATGDVRNGVEAANLLMSMDIPVNSAAMIAGNLVAESAMRGQRPYWVLDDGAGRNGGLLSWNRERLTAIEGYFGRPIQQISNTEQIQYIVKEMQERYPAAWAIVKNPNSTDRQLRRAMFMYIGWGEEGSRWQESARIRSELK